MQADENERMTSGKRKRKNEGRDSGEAKGKEGRESEEK